MPKYVWVRQALYLILLVIVVGCNWQPRRPLPPPQSRPPTLPTFSCASFTESYWQEFRFGSDSPDDVVETVVRLWGIERDQVEFDLTIDKEIYHAYWGGDTAIGKGGWYGARFDDGQQLRKISVEWGFPKPTLSQIVECPGVPDSYTAFYNLQGEVDFLSLALFYPESGIAVRHFAPSWTTESPKIHPDMRMERFVVVPAGTAAQVITEMYRIGNEVPIHIRSVCLLKPWPGSIEALEIASDEEKDHCGFFQ